jgi:hypothetical protein
MDTTSGAWLEGYRLVYVVTILDDYSRAVVACRVFASDSSYHNLLTLRWAMERHGRPRVLSTDNDSKFRLTRYQRSHCYTYRQETLDGLVEADGPGRCSTENTHSDTILGVTNVSGRVHVAVSMQLLLSVCRRVFSGPWGAGAMGIEPTTVGLKVR